jgi:AcrR family transcriptional regulator
MAAPQPRPDASAPPRPLRADARRNRARVLEAAEAVFAAGGVSASTEEVARAAGVGIGTVFRHFPTKEALLEAVYVERLRRLAEEARTLRESPDPGAAFFSFFRRVVGYAATKNALADALADAGIDVGTASRLRPEDMLEALGALLARAQETGAVRRDVGLPELLALLVGASRAREHAAGNPEVQNRVVGAVLDGLRPRG